jgi:hypothetical protein
MSHLIPLLKDLCFVRNGYAVPADFGVYFVKLHDENWSVAQEHWERIVEMVLATDAIHRHLSSRRAMRRAVNVAGVLLSETPLRNRCPLCGQRSKRTKE